MTSLAGKTPANTFKDLLQVSNSNSGIDGTLRPVEDGEGTQSPLFLSSTAARFAGMVDFAGTGHAGLRLNNLTTTQRDALTAAAGMVIYNSTSGQVEGYTDEWGPLAGSGTVSSGTIYASSFGTPNGTNDQALMQAAFDAAVAGNCKLCWDGPRGTVYNMGGTISAPASLRTPSVNSISTSDGLVTFDRAHNIATGDVISFNGSSNIGSGGGLTQVNVKTEMFFARATADTGYLYDTRARAISGGATGKYIPSAGMATTGSFNATTTTASVSSGATTVIVADASKLIVGDKIFFAGTGATVFPKITNIAGNTLTISPAYSGGTVASGTTVWTTSCDVASTQNLEVGTILIFVGPSTNNSVNTLFIISAIVGNTVHFNNPPNNNLPTPGATQTITVGLWADPKYLALKFEMYATPGVVIKKGPNFAGEAMFQFFYGSHFYFHDLELWGKTYGYTPDPGLVNGDDGIRVLGSNGVKVERCLLKYFGDSALRFHTSSFFVAARSTSHPEAGVYSNNIVVRDSYFLDCFQLSTTNSNSDYQGASADVWYVNNKFEGIGGSVKFANRAPGSMNIYLLHNILDKSGRHGFELDSVDNYVVVGNTFRNIKKSGVLIIANNVQPIGFAFNDAKVNDNIFFCAGAVAGGGAIFFNSDLYPDNTKWDYRGLEMCRNKIYDVPAGAYPIQVAGGALIGARIQDNTIDNCANTTILQLTPRISTNPNARNAFMITGNIVRRCAGTKCTWLYLVPSNGAAGGPYLRGVMVANNQFDASEVTLGSGGSNDGRFIWFDYVQDLMVVNNQSSGFLGNAIYNQNEGKDITIRGNDFVNLNTASGNILALNGVDGVYVSRNRMTCANSGTSVASVDRKCSNVKIANDNDVSQSASKSVLLGNVPNKSGANGEFRHDFVSSAPNAGTHDPGDRYELKAPAAGSSPGGICTTGGTYGSLSATGDSTTGSATLANISSMSNLSIGVYLTHPGFTGTRRIITMGTNSVTLDANATSDQTAGALAASAPQYKAYSNIAS